MKNIGEKIQSFLIVGVVLFIIFGVYSEDSSSSSPEYQEEKYLAEQEELIESHIEEQKYQEELDKEYEMWATELYFIDNGYYYHEDRNCKGLEGYDNVNIIYYDELIDHQELKACNWCV